LYGVRDRHDGFGSNWRLDTDRSRPKAGAITRVPLPPIAPQKRTSASQMMVSALPSKVDMCGATSDVRFGPESRPQQIATENGEEVRIVRNAAAAGSLSLRGQQRICKHLSDKVCVCSCSKSKRGFTLWRQPGWHPGLFPDQIQRAKQESCSIQVVFA